MNLKLQNIFREISPGGGLVDKQGNCPSKSSNAYNTWGTVFGQGILFFQEDQTPFMLFEELTQNSITYTILRKCRAAPCKKNTKSAVFCAHNITMSLLYELFSQKIHNMSYVYSQNHFFPIDICDADVEAIEKSFMDFETAIYETVKKEMSWLQNVHFGNLSLIKSINKCDFRKNCSAYFKVPSFSNDTTTTAKSKSSRNYLPIRLKHDKVDEDDIIIVVKKPKYDQYFQSLANNEEREKFANLIVQKSTIRDCIEEEPQVKKIQITID